MEFIVPSVAELCQSIRDSNEVTLARELYTAFEASDEIMMPLREIGWLALNYLVKLGQLLREKAPGSFKEYWAELEDDSRLQLWGEGSEHEISIMRLIQRQLDWKKLSLSQIGDSLRLLASVVKNLQMPQRGPNQPLREFELANEIWNIRIDSPALLQKVTFPTLGELAEMRAAYQTGLALPGNRKDLWVKAHKEMKFGVTSDKLNGTDGNTPLDGKKWRARSVPFGEGRRVRNMAWWNPKTNDLVQILPTDTQRAKQLAATGYQLRPLSTAQSTYVALSASDKREPLQAIRGMTQFKMKKGSPLYAIDRLFGLPEGADISGTTTDTLWGLETLSAILFPPGPTGKRIYRGKDLKSVLPVLYLLPICTMVSHYHHTLLEVATAQTFNGVIQYAIGFYTTLLADVNPTSTPASSVYAILKKWEDSPTNLRALFFKHEDRTWGLLCNTPSEVRDFKACATVTFERYYEFFDSLKDRDDITLDDVRACLGKAIPSFETYRRQLGFQQL